MCRKRRSALVRGRTHRSSSKAVIRNLYDLGGMTDLRLPIDPIRQKPTSTLMRAMP